MQMKFGIVFGAMLIGTTGCKTLDSVQNTLGGTSPSAEQIQAAYNRAETAYSEAQQAMHLANVELLAEYDLNRIDKAQKEWQDLKHQFSELKAKPHEALDSASFFSSQTVSAEIIEMSQKILALVGGAQAAKKLILSVLEPVRSHFAVLDKFDSQQQFPTRYDKLHKHHNKLKVMLVDGKQPDVEAQLPSYQAQLTRLEKDAVSLYYLGQVNAELKMISASTKAQVLPSVYADARNTADYAQQFINLNVRDYTNIEDKVHSAQLQIFRLEHLFAEHLARKQALDDKQVEAQLLTLENQLLELTEKAGLGDIRHLSFSNQLKAIKDTL
ncbi:hypothetical protein [Pseudoalteromonas luteoviolacea]|uniref:Uncharacterized protein n=1 Tax=Pseudoalteromonas luteoviolacea NCIMB 1942 TaxID=1365253 RepID=A0A161XY82_9GAMM|nr:hypothetical protein [Pseudoalteromonas luteoviolacea]KZN48279.1 hypothetical protein N482_08400 [Pseudoalteromonas luteoviolacea NCIMB 1942]